VRIQPDPVGSLNVASRELLHGAKTMTPPFIGEVTRLLKDIQEGNERAKGALFELVFGELHRQAECLMRRERPGHTLQPTALVNEVFCRLAPSKVFAKAQSRAYFFGAVHRAMRQILREHARERQAEQRPGGWIQTPFDQILEFYDRQKIDVTELYEALDELKALSPRQYEVVTLRYFGGWKMQETADLLGVSKATVENDYRAARAFLRGQLTERG
jgi:RNA polymerase sigma factor (TIGR02999 family)